MQIAVYGFPKMMKKPDFNVPGVLKRQDAVHKDAHARSATYGIPMPSIHLKMNLFNKAARTLAKNMQSSFEINRRADEAVSVSTFAQCAGREHHNPRAHFFTPKHYSVAFVLSSSHVREFLIVRTPSVLLVMGIGVAGILPAYSKTKQNSQ